ncbi:DoxX family protein [Actinomadura bangladeshensis]|uniref:DoxX family membrane protein n=1 Tax=Actinomadura bangladeshensis TaxID=453573 RepID=A0A4R4PBA7_9ACTN|nr:DoxX family membrane protein [Actinomadura bangladeshensis]TDC19369.1 DoxX family membrane protein [Actinomadura bangladeshensis]
MRPFTTLARPLVAAPYIMTGLDAIRDPRERAEQVGPAVKPVADRLDWMPKDPETLVRIEGALSLGTGALLLTGRFRRLTTLMLAAQLIPALATEHRYWTEDDPERRANERSHLLKNAALFGALLMSATEPRRPPRTAELRRAMRESQIRTGAEAKAMRKEAAATLRNARREAAHQVRVARAESGRKSAKQAAKAARRMPAAKPGGLLRTGKAGGTGLFKAGKAGGKAGKGGMAKAGRAGGALTKIGAAGSFKAGKATGALKGMGSRGRSKGGLFSRGGNPDIREMAAFRAGQAAKAGKAAGKSMKAGGATQAAKAVKAGRTVKTGTAVQAGKVLEAVKR